MTREEKDWEIGILRGIERGIQIFLQSGEDTITLSVDVETAKMLAAALREYANSLDKVPDPDTGLIPCGCGGKAVVVPKDNGFYIVCDSCEVSTTQDSFFNGTGFSAQSLDDAREDWNTAMSGGMCNHEN